MSTIRGRRNKSTELALVAIFRLHGITGWRRHLNLPGRPDFVFRRDRLVIFVDGCFWHGCPAHSRHVSASGKYWIEKIARNRERDRRVRRVLRASGWRVIRIWEHDLRYPSRVLSRLDRFKIARRTNTLP